MAKLMTLVKAAPGVSHEAFAQHWRHAFLPSLLQLDSTDRQLLKAVHHHVQPSNIREGEGLPANRWAGVGCYYFETQAAAAALLADPAFKALTKVHSSVMPEATHLLVDEVWIYNRDPSHLPLKMFAFFKRKPHIPRSEALRYYRTTHADVGESVNKNRTVRYIQNHVIDGYRNPDAAYDYDGGPEIWFKNMDIALDLFNDREAMDTLGKDEENFVIRADLLHFLTDEAVVFERESALA
jgi:hypothetical protein